MKGNVLKISSICIVLGVILAVGSVFYYVNNKKPIQSVVTSFEDCVSAGYPVLESYPEQCKTSDGKSFTRDIGNELELRNLIQVSNPRPNQKITSSLSISGQAVGNWFFEASFPIELQDEQGNKLAETVAKAEGEWMTEEFVPFTAKLEFKKPKTNKGKLILKKDNPSGLPENDNELLIPILF